MKILLIFLAVPLFLPIVFGSKNKEDTKNEKNVKDAPGFMKPTKSSLIKARANAAENLSNLPEVSKKVDRESNKKAGPSSQRVSSDGSTPEYARPVKGKSTIQEPNVKSGKTKDGKAVTKGRLANNSRGSLTAENARSTKGKSSIVDESKRSAEIKNGKATADVNARKKTSIASEAGGPEREEVVTITSGVNSLTSRLSNSRNSMNIAVVGDGYRVSAQGKSIKTSESRVPKGDKKEVASTSRQNSLTNFASNQRNDMNIAVVGDRSNIEAQVVSAKTSDDNDARELGEESDTNPAGNSMYNCMQNNENSMNIAVVGNSHRGEYVFNA